MDRLTAMRVFVEVADRGSVMQAADALEMSRAMASRYLEGLEQWLGVRLMHRTTRRLSLTDAGQEALPGCRQLVELSSEVLAAAGARQAAPAGRLRITTSLSFAQSHLTAAVADFVAAHPGTEIELLTVDRAVNLVEERVDLAVRITNRLDDSVVARRLATCRSVLCAAPAYLQGHGEPASPEALKLHPCIIHAYGSRAEYRLQHAGRTLTVAVAGPLSSNETAVVRQATLAGAGIAMLPTYFVADDLRQGRLVRLLPQYEPEPLGIHAVYLSRQHQPRILRAMLDFLASRFSGDMPPWDRGLDAAPAAAEAGPVRHASMPGRKTRRASPS